MKNPLAVKCLPLLACLCLLMCAGLPALAQEVDLDDITMTVVGSGVFEARHLARPDSDAIRRFMQANRDSQPQQPTRPGAEMKGLLEELRLAKEAGDSESVDALRNRMDSFIDDKGMPFPGPANQSRAQEIRQLLPSGDSTGIERMREQRQQFPSDGERRAPFPPRPG